MRPSVAASRLLTTVKRRLPDRVKVRLKLALGRATRLRQRVFPPPPPMGAGQSRAARARLGFGRLVVRAESLGGVRVAAAALDLTRKVSGVDVTVTNWRRPYPGWVGRAGGIAGLVSQSIRLPSWETGRAKVSVRVGQPAPADHLLELALKALDPARALPATLTAALAVEGTRPSWLRTSPVPVDGRRPAKEDEIRPWESAAPLDVLITADPVGDGMAFSPYGLRPPAGPTRILIDIAHDNPIQRHAAGEDRETGTLRVAPTPGGGLTWRVESTRGGRLVVGGRAGDPLDERQRVALAALAGLSHAPTPPDCATTAHAAVLVQLAATGVVLDASGLADETAALLSPELAKIITMPVLKADADPLEWDVRSVVQRRAAMRGHDAGLNVDVARPTSALPTVTALVVTRRPHFVRQVMAALAVQTYPRLDVVVAMHGVELDAEIRAELAELPVPVEVVILPAELNLGEALAEATVRARGTLVTKVDDDDRYGPEHIWDLVLAKRYSGATVVGRGPEFIHLTGPDLTIRRDWPHELFTNVVAGGTIMLARGDLEAVGGWRPVPRSVDRTLLERVIRSGGLVYRTHSFGFVYIRHEEGHTWDPGGADYFLRNPARQWQGLPAALLEPQA